MTQSEIDKIQNLGDTAVARMGAARSATNTVADSVNKAITGDTLSQQIEKCVQLHTTALEATAAFASAASSVASASQALRIAVTAVETAKTAAEKLKTSCTAAEVEKLREADDEAVRCLNDAGAAFQTAPELEQKGTSLMSALLSSAVRLIPGQQAAWITGAIAALGLLLILYGFTDGGRFLDRLSQIPFARGLITFLLSVGTIVIAVLLVVSALMGDGDEKSEKRFTMAKEVLTVLVGIFGTILGFYFASEKSEPQQPTLELSPLVVGGTTASGISTVAATVSGGKSPYTYSFEFKDDVLPAIKDQKAKHGRISQPVTNVTDKAVSFTLVITDVNTNQLSYKSLDDEQIPAKPSATSLTPNGGGATNRPVTP
jgi:hypothetical protein